MLIQLIQKTAGKGVGRREGRKLGWGALHDAGGVQGRLGHFFDGLRINERLFIVVLATNRTLPFSFRGGCFGILQSVRPDPCVYLVCLEWAAAVWGRGERRKYSMRENMVPTA